MKLQVSFLIAILAFANGQMEGKEVNQERRFLADRAVTASELKTHATYAAGLWTSLGGIVYDITNFSHPGGKGTILNVGGKAGDTLYMKAYNNGNHPFTMAQVVSRAGIVRIGPLQNGPAPTKAPASSPVKPPILVTTTKAPTLGTPNNKPPTRRPRPTKRPTRRIVAAPTEENEPESSNDHDNFD